MSNHHLRQRRLKRLRTKNIALNTVCILLVLAGIFWTGDFFWRYANYETTNDAVVDQYIAPVNVRVPGYIKEVLGSGIEASGANVTVQEANIAETKARLWQLEQNYRRYATLLEQESVTRQQYEQVKADFEAMLARYDALQQQREVARSQYTGNTRKTAGAEAAILRKEAELDMARLNLSYTIITAPYDGYMGRRTLEAGQFVQAGQTLTYLVRGNDKWITANYKETQIARIFIGQKIRVRVDAFPDRIFHSTVTAISEATGSKYALVPTDNAAGNFVKIQQRIPVRIDLDDASKEDMTHLRAGMMAVTEAEIR